MVLGSKVVLIAALFLLLVLLLSMPELLLLGILRVPLARLTIAVEHARIATTSESCDYRVYQDWLKSEIDKRIAGSQKYSSSSATAAATTTITED
jgi:hypothetical protein